LAMSLCVLITNPVGRLRSLDERAMLSVMLAAGGMPLVYSPPALCRAPTRHPGFDQTEMRELLRN
jgi:hypothetical protein